jgi:hypothetical protein
MATVPFSFECSLPSAFVMDPNAHPRVGYVTSFDGLGLPAGGLKADLTVIRPVAGDTVTVVGVLEKFSWAGGVGDFIQLDFYVSQENAAQLKLLQQTILKTAAVKQFGWWIADYGQDTKAWFEQAYPQSPPSGIIAGKNNPALNVGLTPVKVKDGIDVNVYEVNIQVAPPANQQYALNFADSPTKKVVKSWGPVVGTSATGVPSLS